MVEILPRNHYRVIVLVLASSTDPVYLKFRDIWYTYLDLYHNIKVYLVYGNTNISPNSNDLIYNDIAETYYPGMITKTLRAIKYINDTYTYDFLLRTNLSTFWDFDLLLSRLDKLDTNSITGTIRKCKYKGIESPNYISGVNLIIPHNLVNILVDNMELIKSWNLPEDWSLSKIYIDLGIPLKPSIPGCIHFMERFTECNMEQVLHEINIAKQMQHDHFRIKNKYDRLLLDPYIMNVLLTQYYGEKIL